MEDVGNPVLTRQQSDDWKRRFGSPDRWYCESCDIEMSEDEYIEGEGFCEICFEEETNERDKV